MHKELSHFFYVLGDKRRQLPFLITLFLCNSFLDALGLGLIGPFMALVSAPQIVQRNQLLGWAYQHSGAPSVSQFVAFVGLAIIGVFCLKLCFNYFSFRYIYTFSFNHQADLQKKLLHAYVSAPYTFHLQSNTALLIQIVTQETQGFCNGVLLPILLAISNGILILLLAALLSLTNLTATTAIAALILCVFGLYSQFRHRLVQWGREASEAGAEVIRIVNHSLGSIKETRVIGCEFYFEEQLAIQARRHAAAYSAYMNVSQLPRLILEGFLMLFLVGFVSLTLIVTGDAAQLIPTLSVFALTSIRLLPSASHFIGAFGSIKNSSHTLHTLYLNLREVEIANAPVQKMQPPPQHSLSAFPSAIRTLSFEHTIKLEHILYRYPKVEEPALKKISLEIPKGQSIALIGKSGAGKTTLVDLILGLLIPESGNIHVDGHSIYSDLRAWQNMVGYIPQSIFLTDDTIEHNIAFGVPNHAIDSVRLQNAVRAAQLEELIEQLPEGLRTPVGERGVRLSGGQRQRVGIARALYHEREILVLDEATAALDNETERLVTDAIRVLSGTKTIIIIAHRLTTVEHCDRVYMLEQGRIVKSGSYEEVIAG